MNRFVALIKQDQSFPAQGCSQVSYGRQHLLMGQFRTALYLGFNDIPHLRQMTEGILVHPLSQITFEQKDY